MSKLNISISGNILINFSGCGENINGSGSIIIYDNKDSSSICINNEMMERESLKEILNNLVDNAILTDNEKEVKTVSALTLKYANTLGIMSGEGKGEDSDYFNPPFYISKDYKININDTVKKVCDMNFKFKTNEVIHMVMDISLRDEYEKEGHISFCLKYGKDLPEDKIFKIEKWSFSRKII